MKKVALLLLAVIFALVALVSCDVEIAEKGETVNQYIYPYIEFTPNEAGTGYTATIVEGAKLETVTIPDEIEVNGQKVKVTSFAGFKNPDDAINLRAITLEATSIIVTSQALEQAVNLESIGVEAEKDQKTWEDLPVLEREGYEFLGWFYASTGEQIHEGDKVSSYSEKISPSWRKHRLVHHVGKTPTCTTSGWAPYDTCQDCDYTTYRALGRTAHELSYQAEQKASCTQAGTREYYQCANCKKYFSDSAGQFEITELQLAALGHSLVAVAKVDEACGKAGMKAHFECTLCHALFKDQAGTEVTTSQELAIAALEHVWKRMQYSTSDTCVWYECERCHETKDAAGHSWDTGEVIKAATETSCGKKKFTCSVCGTEKYEDIEPISGTHEHVWSDVETVVQTCTTRGWKVRECATCGATYRYDYFDPSGHTLSVVEKAATCEEKGKKKHYECSVCHGLFKDENGINATNAEEVKIPALEHAWSKVFSSDDSEHWYACTREGCTARDSVTVHNYNLKNTEVKYQVSDATCTAKARYYYSCECGKAGSLTFEDGPEPSHTLTHHAAVAAISCSVPGSCEYWSCSVCEKNFFDQACTREISDLSETVITIPHNKVSYEWSHDASGHWHRCSGTDCTYQFDVSTHTYVTYGSDEVCSVCNHIKAGQENSQSGGFNIQAAKLEPKGSLAVTTSGEFKRKATFTLEAGYSMTEISWSLDGVPISGESGLSCEFDTTSYRTYKIMCVVSNGDYVTAYEEAIYGGK